MEAVRVRVSFRVRIRVRVSFRVRVRVRVSFRVRVRVRMMFSSRTRVLAAPTPILWGLLLLLLLLLPPRRYTITAASFAGAIAAVINLERSILRTGIKICLFHRIQQWKWKTLSDWNKGLVSYLPIFVCVNELTLHHNIRDIRQMEILLHASQRFYLWP